MTLEVRLARAEEMTAVFALRHEVFVLGQGVPVDLERDDLDASAEHVVALDTDSADATQRLVGTGRLVAGRIDEQGRLQPGPAGTVGTVGRMAVATSARGTGVGRAVLEALVDRARARGLSAIELHAQVHAKAFYERAGFEPFGEVYLEAGIDHVGMRREV